MRTFRLLQFHLALMACLASFMLGLAQRNMMMAGLLTAAAVTSLLFTDTLGWFRMHRVFANLAMVLAAVFSLNGFFRSDSQQQLIAIANLLVYVQILLLFQVKTLRIFGYLGVFSLLQVVVAALLSEGLEFGVLLGLYVIVAVSALGLFHISGELERLRTTTLASAQRRRRTKRSSRKVIVRARSGRSRRQLEAQMLSWSLARQTVVFTLLTVTFAVIFFTGAPRSGSSSWHGNAQRRSIVGFAPEIELGDIGRIMQSDQLVMRVSFREMDGQTTYTVVGQPYFRGGVLTHYGTVRGRSRWQQDVGADLARATELAQMTQSRAAVRQEFYLEPTAEPVLFSVFPAYALPDTPDEVRFLRERRHLVRLAVSEAEQSQPFRYAVATTGFRFGAQVAALPHINRARNSLERRRLAVELRRLSYIEQPEAITGLIDIANGIVAEEAEDASRVDIARALEAHFLEPDRYQYSLDQTTVASMRRMTVDPVEDFVTNHRTGHCEYFASALALMLRSQGIPARMVVGYRGGDFNHVGEYFLVRQRHAHAWVEAYLPPEEIPENSLLPSEIHPGGGWLRLDPTPAVFRMGQSQRTGLLNRLSHSFDYMQLLWSDYVLRLAPKSAVGGDGSISSAGLDRLLQRWDQRRWENRLQRVRNNRDRWTQWVLGGLGLAGVWLLARRLPRLRRRMRRRRRRRERERSRQAPGKASIRWFRRLDRLLARSGLPRPPSQTPREWAAEAGERIRAWEICHDHAGMPTQLVDTFYRIRFGGESLAAGEQERIESDYRELRRVLKQAGARRPLERKADHGPAVRVPRSNPAASAGSGSPDGDSSSLASGAETR